MIHTGDCDICKAKILNRAKKWKHMNGPLQMKMFRVLYPEKDKSKEKRAALAEMKAFLLQTKGRVCEECRDTKRPLDLSHLLSQGAHPDLALELENVVLHCRACHVKWENGTLEWKRASVTFSKHWTYIQKHSTRL
jgi:hypothetical protein